MSFGPIARRSARTALVGLALGSVLGAAVGAAAGFAAVAAADRLHFTSGLDPMLQAALTHAVAWGLVGAVAGLVSGALTGRLPQTIGHACAGGGSGIVAPFVFAPIAAGLFPLVKTDLPVPDGAWTRLLWLVIGAGAISASLAFTGTKRKPPIREMPDSAG